MSEACQFDWSDEIVLLRGATTEIKVVQVSASGGTAGIVIWRRHPVAVNQRGRAQ